jgi:hypothetical protein
LSFDIYHLKLLFMNDILPTILLSSFTKSDILRRIHFLRSYLEVVHFKKSDSSIQDFLISKNATKSDVEAITSWKIDTKGSFGREDLYQTIEKLLKTIEQLPSVTLFVPFEPDSTSVTKIGLWAREHINTQIIIDLRLDPEAVGGAKLAWNGHFGDYSLGRILEKEKDAIREMINKKIRVVEKSV